MTSTHKFIRNIAPGKHAYYGRPKPIMRSLNNDMLVGWFPALGSQCPDFQSRSRNMAEFLACEMVYAGYLNHVYDHSLLKIFQAAEAQGRRFCLLVQVGWWSSALIYSIDSILDSHQNRPSVIGLGGNDNLSGMSIVDIDWWVSAGRPDPGNIDFFQLARQHGAVGWPERAGERILRIMSLHPDASETHKRRFAEESDIDIFFCANTEDFSLDTVSAHNYTTDTIITVAGGLSAVLLSYGEQMPAGSRIVVVDTSELAIKMSKLIFQEWDGENYAEFMERLIAQGTVNVKKLRGEHKLRKVDAELKKIPGFVEWFNTVFKTYKIEYRDVDLLNPDSVKNLLEDVILRHGPSSTSSRRVYIHFSNVYHYMPTAAVVSYDVRRSVAAKVKEIIVDVCARGNVTSSKIKDIGRDLRGVLNVFPWRQAVVSE